MIRPVVVALVTLALGGCPGDGGGTDAAIDAPIDGVGIDGDGDAAPPRVCEASPATPPQMTTGGSVLGAWDLTWSCSGGCIGNRPGLTYAHHADITTTAIAFSSTGCARCALTHAATQAGSGCLDVEAGADWDVQCRFSYRLCERNGTVEATITWKEPGLSTQSWLVVGTH